MAIKVSRILHAGYVFECLGTKIVFDPILENPFSINCHAFPSVSFNFEKLREEIFDAIFISHYHDDHFSLESLNLFDRNTPIYMYCHFAEVLDLIRDLGFTSVTLLELNKPVAVGCFEIIPRKALDVDVDSLLQIKADSLNILNVVDSWIDYETLALLKAQGPWDLILWPFQTMREIEVLSPSHYPPAPRQLPPEWIEQIQILRPRFIVPSSCQFINEEWSWYRKVYFPITYAQFDKEISTSSAGSQVIRMNPSTSIELTKNSVSTSNPLPFVTPEGPQDVDYDYDETFSAPPTSDIAKNFSALSKTEKQMILEYCQEQLLDKYRSLEFYDDSFFCEPRVWKLSLLDHRGLSLDFFYCINKSQIVLTPKTQHYSWSTELPISKLYGALTRGESLSSMYVRIDKFFGDPMEDPLLRCLFNGDVGSYQRAQLLEIQSSGGHTRLSGSPRSLVVTKPLSSSRV